MHALGLVTFSCIGICLHAAAAPVPPNREAVGTALAPPPAAHLSGTCTATGTWGTNVSQGIASWTMPRAGKRKPWGTWTDQFTYTWVLQKGRRGTLTGTVTYHGIPNCTADTWPVTGRFEGRNLQVTATNPDIGDNCVSYYGSSLTIQ